jgi:murein DD-endopeptidase MepM/ murein hydrolase activator NlpD
LHQATVLVLRAFRRLARDQRRTVARLTQLRRPAGPTESTVRVARARRAPVARPAASSSRFAGLANRLRRPRLADLAADRRGSPVLVLCLVLVASLLAAVPDQGVAVGGTDGPGVAAQPRIAALAGGAVNGAPRTASDLDGRSFQPFDLPATGTGDVTGTGDEIADPGAQFQNGAAYTIDGTLLKPLTVETDVSGIEDQVRTYRVEAGDTLVGIADKFGLRMMTLWWANKLPAKDELRIGQLLVIPPVDGILYTVKEGDTLEGIADAYSADIEEIIAFNDLEGDTIVIGQQLMVPDGRGKGIPTPKPEARPRSGSGGSGGGGGSCGSCSFGGGMRWPVGGSNYISQGFRYGHYAVDIAADYGTPVLAAAAGKVTFTGWRSGGGGYQIWISHGNGMYTTYNHLSAITTSTGAYVAKGERIGRIGESGRATGPHLHFEVWRGPIWDGGYRVNPLKYF